jgi:hypothetical protein
MPEFDGLSYSPDLDKRRLSSLLDAVRELMSDGAWRTAAEIKAVIGRGSESGIGARIRDLRKDKFGAYAIERRRRGDSNLGLFEFRMRVASRFDEKGQGILLAVPDAPGPEHFRKQPWPGTR